MKEQIAKENPDEVKAAAAASQGKTTSSEVTNGGGTQTKTHSIFKFDGLFDTEPDVHNITKDQSPIDNLESFESDGVIEELIQEALGFEELHIESPAPSKTGESGDEWVLVDEPEIHAL